MAWGSAHPSQDEDAQSLLLSGKEKGAEPAWKPKGQQDSLLLLSNAMYIPPLKGNFFTSKGFQLVKFKVKNKPPSRSFSGAFQFASS